MKLHVLYHIVRVIIALLLNWRRKIHIVPSGFSVKGSMMCLTQSLWYILYISNSIYFWFFVLWLSKYFCTNIHVKNYHYIIKKLNYQRSQPLSRRFDIVIDNYELASSTLDFQSYPYTFIWWGNTYKSLSQIPYK